MERAASAFQQMKNVLSWQYVSAMLDADVLLLFETSDSQRVERNKLCTIKQAAQTALDLLGGLTHRSDE